jgi:hypothetical protein
MVADPSTHAAHHAGLAWTVAPIVPAGLVLDPDSWEAHDLLGSLDDAMFAAIAGDTSAVAGAWQLWERARAVLPRDLVEESREQYLRFAADVTRRIEADDIRDAAKVLVALEIIDLLTR